VVPPICGGRVKLKKPYYEKGIGCQKHRSAFLWIYPT
jgi:hypothetical protein